MSPLRLLPLCSLVPLFGLNACNSKIDSALDTTLQAKVDTVTGCMPDQIAKLDDLLDFAALWRQGDNAANPPDPAGLSWSYAGGEITYSIARSGYAISGKIRFYGPNGNQETGLTLSSTSLSQAIDDAATELRSLHASGRPFLVGEWNFTGTGVGSAGVTSSPPAFTGFIAGSANQNELEELRTTEGTAQVSGGAPAVQQCSITSAGSETCVFTFRIASLLTDESPTQDHPIGTIEFSLANQTAGITLNGSLVMDGTATAVLNVDTIPGHFAINIDTHSVTHEL